MCSGGNAEEASGYLFPVASNPPGIVSPPPVSTSTLQTAMILLVLYRNLLAASAGAFAQKVRGTFGI